MKKNLTQPLSWKQRYFLFWPDFFGRVVKRFNEKTQVNFKIYVVIYWEINNCNKHIAKYVGGGWHFPNLSFLHWKIILLFAKLSYTFEENFFSATIISWKKVILSCLKMSGCMCKEGWNEGRTGVVCVRLGGTKYLKREWNKKEGRGNKNFRKGRKLGQGVGALKTGGWNPLTNYELFYYRTTKVWTKK